MANSAVVIPEDKKDVKITKTWAFTAFCKEFGKPSLYVDPEEGFTSLAFRKDGEEKSTFVHFGPTCAGYTESDVMNNYQNLTIGKNTNGNYSCYKADGGNFHSLNIEFLSSYNT